VELVTVIVPMLIKSFMPVIKLAENVFRQRVNWEYDPYRKELRIALPVENSRYHIIAIKISERKWPLPEGMVLQYFDKLLHHTIKKVKETRRAEAWTVVLIGNITYPASRGYPKRALNLFKCLFNLRLSGIKKCVRMLRQLIASLYERKAQELRRSCLDKDVTPYGWVNKLINYFEAIRELIMLEDYALALFKARSIV